MNSSRKETFNLSSDNLVQKVKELIEEGNVTRITINNKSGKELMNFSLTVGLVGLLIAPILAAVVALAAVVGEYSVTVERSDTPANGSEPMES